MKFFVIWAGLFLGSSAFATTLECTNNSKDNFVNDKKVEVTITGNNIRVESKSMDYKGSFMKVISKTGDSQYSVPDLDNLLDQSDLGTVFVSADLRTVTFSLRFTDDDGPQSWYRSTYHCSKK